MRRLIALFPRLALQEGVGFIFAVEKPTRKTREAIKAPRAWTAGIVPKTRGLLVPRSLPSHRPARDR